MPFVPSPGAKVVCYCKQSAFFTSEFAMQSRQYAHWHQFFEDIPVSPTEFYNTLEQSLEARKVPDISLMHVEFPEGGAFSPKRLYLEVRRDWLTYHTLGTQSLVSSVLHGARIRLLPISGRKLSRLGRL